MGIYHNGSDMLLIIDSKAIGHCTTHSVSFSSESKDRAVKPAASVAMSAASKFKSKSVTGLSVSVSGEGLIFSGETEESYAAMMTLWASGASVAVECYQRGNSSKPYMSGNFVITSLERTDPAEDDSTYSISLENDGAVEFDDTAFNNGTEGE